MLRVARYEPGLVTNAIIRAGSNSWEHLASSKWKSGTALGKQTSNQQRIEGWLKFQMTTQQLETGNTEMYHTTELKPKQHLFICIYIYIHKHVHRLLFNTFSIHPKHLTSSVQFWHFVTFNSSRNLVAAHQKNAIHLQALGSWDWDINLKPSDFNAPKRTGKTPAI